MSFEFTSGLTAANLVENDKNDIISKSKYGSKSSKRCAYIDTYLFSYP